MHTLSLPFLAPSLFATLVFGLYFVPPGFLFAGLTNIAGFWARSLSEKLLWAIGLSFPVGTMTAVLVGHYAGQGIVNPVFLIYAVAALALAFYRYRKGHLALRSESGRHLIPLLLALGGTTLFCLVATCAIRVNGGLYEGVFTNDWYIRIPLQYIAPLTGVPSVNPLFTLAGQNPTLTYHYFSYVLCAQPMRLAGLDARSVLVASTVWACFIFFATGWLMLKYLALPATGRAFTVPGDEPYHPRLRRMALLFFVVSIIGGLDLIPILFHVVRHHELQPAFFWWGDSTISAWPGWVMFGPHHMMGLAAGLMGYLLLTLIPKDSRYAWLSHPLLASLCFAALAGTSVFIALATFLAATLLGMDGLIRRDWKLVSSVAGSLLLALVLDSFFLVAILGAHRALPAPVATTAATTAIATTGAMSKPKYIKFTWSGWPRSNYRATSIVNRLHRFAHFVPTEGPVHGLLIILLAVPLLLMVYFIHSGFFSFILVCQANQDVRSTLTFPRRALWLLFLCYVGLDLFVSSAPMQNGMNDLGRDTALGARMVLMLWACPLIAAAWHHYRNRNIKFLARSTQLALGVAAICGVLGLAGDLVDATVQRIYLPLVDHGAIKPREPFLYSPGVASDFAELQDAWQQIGRVTPANAIVQHNPDSFLQRMELLYLNRRMAAGDRSCETSFGGDEPTCVQTNVRPLLSLYGQPEPDPSLARWKIAPDESLHAFDTVCASLKLTALIVTDYDPAWNRRDSWVWQRPSLYAGPHVRVISCPSTPL